MAKKTKNSLTSKQSEAKKIFFTVYQLVTDIKWHMENEVWNCNREALETNGNLKLSINYE